MSDRNHEFEEVLDSGMNNQITYFVSELNEELDDIARTLDTESSKILLNWVRDKIRILAEDFTTK